MTKEKMLVHEALCELKTIGNRIEKEIGNAVFVTANKHSNQKISGVSIQEFKDRMVSDYQSITDLINRRNAMKRAVVLSNATTKVTIGDVEYTVAEAIDMKQHAMEFYNSLLGQMTRWNTMSLSELKNNSGDALERRAENYMLSVIQAQPKDSKMSVDSDAMKQLRATYIADNTYDLIDPLNISEKMKQLEEYISKFNTKVDAALSVSNATTVIEFEY